MSTRVQVLEWEGIAGMLCGLASSGLSTALRRIVVVGSGRSLGEATARRARGQDVRGGVRRWRWLR
jgi:hypothetical protein